MGLGEATDPAPRCRNHHGKGPWPGTNDALPPGRDLTFHSQYQMHYYGHMCASLPLPIRARRGTVRRPARRWRATLFVIAAATALATLSLGRPWVLFNRTPSEPEGFYLGTLQAPQVGRIVAFHAPEAAFPYADRHMPYLRRTLLLKEISAGPGDHVCTDRDRLAINGADRAPIVRADRQGSVLPRWTGCRTLGIDEFFVYSDRVPNSFDSRYFGPVERTAVIGVFRLLVPSRERR